MRVWVWDNRDVGRATTNSIIRKLATTNMWNYPFDPNEIEGEDRESSLWVATLWVLAVVTITYFGGHFLVFILNQ